MKMPDNISPEIAAYIRVLQTENSKLQNKNSELQNEVLNLKTKVEKQELQISNLTEMLVNSRKKIFGRSSEKSKFFDDAQLTLINEAETIAERLLLNLKRKPSLQPTKDERNAPKRR